MKQSIIYIAICLVCQLAYSQPQVPATPTAAAINYQQYASSNTNYFDGGENVTVPIGAVSEGPLSHTVSLSYNTKGILVSQVASPAGLGWRINAGGMVSRTIRGISDGDAGGYGFYEMNDKGHSINDDQAASGDRDRESDLYRFSVGSFNGSFVLDDNNIIHTIPKSNVKIEIEWEARYGYDFARFIITDEYGTKYYFGSNSPNDFLEFRSNSALMKTRCCNSDQDDIVGWFLYKIESYDGKHEITFDYDRTGYSYHSLATQQKLFWDEVNGSDDGSSPHIYGGTYSLLDDVFTYYSVSSWDIAKISTSTKEIVFNNENGDSTPPNPRLDLPTSITEEYCNNPPCEGAFSQTIKPNILTSINVNHLGSSTCRGVTYELNHSYFDDQTNYHNWTYPTWAEKRLKLLDIQKFDCSGTVSEPPTVFDYYGSNFFPNYVATGLDHWGFYNGQNTTSYNLIPFTTITAGSTIFSYGSSNRDPEIDETEQGVLKRVTFPTGGHIEYEYELNDVAEDSGTSYLFNSSPCVMPECCNAVYANGNNTVYITQDIKDNSTLEMYLLTVGSASCGGSWFNSEIKVEVKENGQHVQYITYNLTNNGQGTQSGYLDTDLSGLSYIEVGHTYDFLVSGDKLQDDSYARLTNSSSYVTTPVGGLRIKKKTIHDGYDSARDIIQEYDYTNHGTSVVSSGNLIHDANIYAIDITDNADYDQALFLNMAYYPMYDFNGSHINYTEVTISNNGEGKTELTFKNPNGDGFDDYPPQPINYSNTAGFLEKTEIYDSNDNSISVEENLQEDDLLETLHTTWTTGYTLYYNGLGIETDHIEKNAYSVKTGISRIDETTTTVDGFISSIDYNYPGSGISYLPSESIVINSDGKEHSTFNYYTSDYTWGESESGNQNEFGCLKDEFIEKNIRNVLWKTEKVFDTNVVDGSVTEYKLYNSNGSQASNCSTGNNTNKHLRAYKVYRDERSWNASGQLYPSTENWELLHTNISYNSNGLLKETSMPGWAGANSIYSYDAFKRLISKQVAAQTESYEYIDDSMLLEEVTDIYGNSTSYEYDDLVRLKKVTQDCNGVNTEYSYHFTTGSPTPDNYIKSIEHYEPACGGSCNLITEGCLVTDIESRAYLDGLGRQVQTVGVQHQPGLNANGDIINAVEYDEYGRSFRSFLPYVSPNSNNGAFVNPSTSWGYSESNYYDDPLSRTENIDPPGSLTGAINSFGTNDSSDQVIQDHNTGTYYSPGSLSKTIVTDANDIQSISFKDRLGNLICQRTLQNGSTTFDDETYYLYDGKNRLSKVLPQGSDLTTSEIYFSYLYYVDDQIYKKKVPSKDEVTYVYNNRGLLSVEQDGNMKANNEYFATNYDLYGKIIETGLKSHPSLPSNESFSSVVLDPTELMTSYTYVSHKLSEFSKRILGTSNFIIESYTYDSCNRLTSISSNTQLDLTNMTSLVVNNFYNQISELKEVQTTLTIGSSSYTFGERFFYENEGRLVKYYINDIDFQTSNYVQVSDKTFNGREELIKDRIGPGTNVLQVLDYTYTDWGALKTINSASLYDPSNEVQIDQIVNLMTPASSVLDRDLFYLELYYDDAFDTNGNGSRNNLLYEDGSISAVRWQLRGRRENAYLFEYDNKYQLVEADFYEQNEYSSNDNFSHTDLFSASYSYGERGLINSINREGVNMNDYYDPPFSLPSYSTCTSGSGAIYFDDSNQIEQYSYGTCSMNLMFVGFDISYDDNGNMTNHPLYKNIEYNYLDQIESYDQDNQNDYDATHTADGQLLSEGTRDFIGPFEFVNSNLFKIHYQNGYIDSNNDWNFYLKDHLGNNRVVFSDKDSDNAINSLGDIIAEYHYYPFGLQFNGPWFGGGSNEMQFNGIRFHESDYNDNLGHADLRNLGLSHAKFRSLDPVMGMWLQVDPKAEWQMGMSPYCAMNNNPITFNDPNGDIAPLVVAAIVAGGGLINLGVQAYKGNINSFGDGLAAFGVGAAATGAGLLTGGAATGAFGTATLGASIASGAVAGAAGGATAGFIQETGNGLLLQDLSLGESLGQGLNGALWGGIGGAVIGGVAGGIGYSKPSASPAAAAGDDTFTVVVDGKSITVPGYTKEFPNVATGQFGGGSVYTTTVTNATGQAANPFRAFTASNFRINLGRYSGGIPKNSHAHHVFPKKYSHQFSKAGINIHDPKYGTWWEATSHLKNAKAYNSAWGDFFRAYPNPTQSQILGYGRNLMNQYGIPIGF